MQPPKRHTRAFTRAVSQQIPQIRQSFCVAFIFPTALNAPQRMAVQDRAGNCGTVLMAYFRMQRAGSELPTDPVSDPEIWEVIQYWLLWKINKNLPQL